MTRPPGPHLEDAMDTVDALNHALADDTHTDGNALAGPLSEIFAVDVTGARTRCTGCGTGGPLAGLHVYSRAPGLVARCPACGQVMLRLVTSPGEVWLDLRGCTALGVRAGT
jgi:hypothetical protein